MKVFTYFRSDPQLPFAKNLLDTWVEAWGNAEVSPVILTKEPTSHRAYDAVKQKVASFPNVNPAAYQEHCFMRWLAAAQMRGQGGLFVDSDVLPTQHFCVTGLLHLVSRHALLCLDESRCPCAVWATLKGCHIICDAILQTSAPNKPHFSDQELFRENQWATADMVGTWPDMSKPLAHFATSPLIAAGKIASVHDKASWIADQYNQYAF